MAHKKQERNRKGRARVDVLVTAKVAPADKLEVSRILDEIDSLVWHQFLPDDGGVPHKVEQLRALLGIKK